MVADPIMTSSLFSETNSRYKNSSSLESPDSLLHKGNLYTTETIFSICSYYPRSHPHYNKICTNHLTGCGQGSKDIDSLIITTKSISIGNGTIQITLLNQVPN